MVVPGVLIAASTAALSASRSGSGFQSCGAAVARTMSFSSGSFAAVYAFHPPFSTRASGTPASLSIHHARAASRRSSLYTTVGLLGWTPTFASSSFQNAASALPAVTAFDHAPSSAGTAPGTCPASYFAFPRRSSTRYVFSFASPTSTSSSGGSAAARWTASSSVVIMSKSFTV